MLVLPARGRWGGKLWDPRCEGSCSMQGERGKENSQRVGRRWSGGLALPAAGFPPPAAVWVLHIAICRDVSPGTQELGKVLGPIPSPPRLGCHRVPGGAPGLPLGRGRRRSLTVCSGCSRAPGGARGWSSGSRSAVGREKAGLEGRGGLSPGTRSPEPKKRSVPSTVPSTRSS